MLSMLESAAVSVNMTVNIKNTVCVIFNPTCKQKAVCDSFLAFKLAVNTVCFVNEIKYFVHIIDHFLHDVKTMLLMRRFDRCSTTVK